MADLIVSVQQAAVNALATYINSKLEPIYGDEGIDVLNRWPEPGYARPRRVISLHLRGTREYEMMAPEVDVTVSQATGQTNVRLYVWKLGYVEQPIVIDIWAESHAERDDLCARLDTALRDASGNDYAIGDPFEEDLVLALGDGYFGTADFYIDSGPDYTDTAESIQVGEYRASFTLHMSAPLSVQAASAALARIQLRQVMLNEGGTYETVSVTDVTAATLTIP